MDETSDEEIPSRPVKVHAATSARMSRQKRKDTAPELELRRALYRRGLRYRVDRPLEGMPRRRADVTFVGAKVVVFVDGCFWHRCPVHATAPANNSDWWERKLAGNAARDCETDTRLREAGWVVLRFWEHEDMEAAAVEVARVLRERRSAQEGQGGEGSRARGSRESR